MLCESSLAVPAGPLLGGVVSGPLLLGAGQFVVSRSRFAIDRPPQLRPLAAQLLAWMQKCSCGAPVVVVDGIVAATVYL